MPDMNESNSKKCSNCKKTELLLEHATKYFEIHANQRISLFRFYIAFFAFFLAGSGFLAVRFSLTGIYSELAGIIISIIFIIITETFRRLDCRNHQLIHYGEDALREIESTYFNNLKKETKIKIFIREREDVCDKKSHTSHTTCFKIIYITAYISAGLLFFLALFSLMLKSPS